MKVNIKIILLLFLATLSVSAQQRLEKASQTITANKNVTITLNTSHTNIEVDTWNKDYVEVEAYIESKKLTKEALQAFLADWDLDISGSGNAIRITSKGSRGNWSSAMNLDILDNESLEALSNINFDMDLNLKPLLEGLSGLESLKDLPEALKVLRIPESPDGNYNMDFDFDAYQKEGESYLDAWSKKYRTEYGEEYEQEMRDWAKSIKQSDLNKFEKRMEAWGVKFGSEFEEAFENGFGKDFEKSMEKWGEAFGKSFEKEIAPALEKWGEEFGKAFEAKMEDAFGEGDSKGKQAKKKPQDLIKTLRIKMPKKAQLKLNVRHGELKMAAVMHNVKADLAHGKLTAQTIDGSHTSINVSYSDLAIVHWNAGELKLKYVDQALVGTANELLLNAVSSNIAIANLKGNTVIDGSFGELTINNILPSFNNLNIVLENSDARLKLPKTLDYKLYFKGNRSTFNNETLSNKTITNDPNSNSANNTIVINAKFSSVITQ
jgi:hypothetical protein